MLTVRVRSRSYKAVRNSKLNWLIISQNSWCSHNHCSKIRINPISDYVFMFNHNDYFTFWDVKCDEIIPFFQCIFTGDKTLFCDQTLCSGFAKLKSYEWIKTHEMLAKHAFPTAGKGYALADKIADISSTYGVANPSSKKCCARLVNESKKWPCSSKRQFV